MKNKLFTIPVLLMLLIVQGGCAIIGYRTHFSRDLTPEQQSKVVWGATNDELLSLTNDGRIYAINGKQLKQLVEAQPKAIVYRWSPHCTSESCLILGAMQTFCDQNGITLFVVADYFHESFSQIHAISNPLYIANEHYYKTSICHKLEKRFYIDLLGEETYNATKDISWYRYIYFKNGKFVKYLEDPYAEFGDDRL